jgi:hypothetical protein
MDQTPDIVDRLISRWRQQGVSLRAPCSAAEIQAFEQREHLVLPEEFRQYLCSADGMQEEMGQSQDSEGFSFWPLRRLVPAHEELRRRSPHTPPPVDSPDYYVFADYLDWSWAYALKLRPAGVGKVIIVGAQSVSAVADSFSEFIQVYISDGRALYPPT